ncbi:deoxyribose-phosphate aldolase [Brevibacterium limosum]|uniref:deoxyribose-phosphate aldolase n=1 Tax=Brevibacterium limosum TaxID=2697565 RepID=UPI00141F6072|nr:deoxyribose-phosphate aldolase [Brevibacterium limosum]
MSKTDFASLSSRELAPYIQHTKISVGITRDEIIAHAQETVEYGFGAAMVPGPWVKTVADTLKGTEVPVATALDFPTVGVTSSAGKAAEAAELVRLGADQIDIGVQIGWLKSGDFDAFRDDIAGVVKAAGVPIKVMLELPLLTEDEKTAAVELSLEAGVSYLKNASSGAIETASPGNIRYLAERSPVGVLVKASGGIKSRAQVIELLQAGAACAGTSAGIEIITDTASSETASY